MEGWEETVLQKAGSESWKDADAKRKTRHIFAKCSLTPKTQMIFEFWEYNARKMGTSNSVTNEPEAILPEQGFSSRAHNAPKQASRARVLSCDKPRKAYNLKG